MLPLPDEPTDRIRLADWLELCALGSPDGNASSGDLETALKRGSLLDEYGSEAIQQTAMEVFDELEERAKAAQIAYPFTINAPMIQVRDVWNEHPAYVFCLCLSYFGHKHKKGSRDEPRRWFEHLSRDAAQHYLGGEALRFGSPRLQAELPKSFKSAIGEVCRRLKEGEGYRAGGLPQRKDDELDIIAWKPFPDELPGKLILFGNCASERDWEGSKKTQLSPEPFYSDWMIDPPKCQIIKSLFIPHRVERLRFIPLLKRAGIIFDRCRIAHWAYRTGPCSQQVQSQRFMTYEPLAAWSLAQIQRVTA